MGNVFSKTLNVTKSAPLVPLNVQRSAYLKTDFFSTDFVL